MNHELPDVQAGFRKCRGTRDQIANICWIIEKARDFPKKSTALLTMPKPLTVWITTNCGKFWKRWGYQTHPTCLLRNLYADQGVTVRTEHGTTDWFQIRKWVCQGYILSPCLFNLYVEYIMWNARLDESQAEIKTAGRNISNLIYAYDTTLMAESKEELKSLLWRWKRRMKKLAYSSTFRKLRSWHLVPSLHGK